MIENVTLEFSLKSFQKSRNQSILDVITSKKPLEYEKKTQCVFLQH